MKATDDLIIEIVLRHYPAAQAIYLFGSYGTPDEWPDSDLDIAVLLPPEAARRAGDLMLSPCRFELEEALGREVDLLNARRVSTVMQKEIISRSPRYVADRPAMDEWEMLTLSYYQRLNEERREILEAFQATGRAYDV